MGLRVVSADLDPATVRSKFRGVFDQVPKHLLETSWIGPAMMFDRFEMAKNPNAFRGNVRRGDAQRVFEGGVDIHGVVMQFQFSVGDSGQVQKIVNQEG